MTAPQAKRLSDEELAPAWNYLHNECGDKARQVSVGELEVYQSEFMERHLATLRAALAARGSGQTPLPMESAPRDRSRVLLRSKVHGHWMIGSWHSRLKCWLKEESGSVVDEEHLDAWLPLPPPAGEGV